MLCVTIAPWPAAALALQEIQQNVPVDSRGATVGWLLLCRYTGMRATVRQQLDLPQQLYVTSVGRLSRLPLVQQQQLYVTTKLHRCWPCDIAASY